MPLYIEWMCLFCAINLLNLYLFDVAYGGPFVKKLMVKYTKSLCHHGMERPWNFYSSLVPNALSYDTTDPNKKKIALEDLNV